MAGKRASEAKKPAAKKKAAVKQGKAAPARPRAMRAPAEVKVVTVATFVKGLKMAQSGAKGLRGVLTDADHRRRVDGVLDQVACLLDVLSDVAAGTVLPLKADSTFGPGKQICNVCPPPEPIESK